MKVRNLVNTETPRFEFRSFAQNFGIVEQKIRMLSAVENIRESAEIYILSAKNDTHNIKIRNDVLDIKVLMQKKKGLEQWQPFMKHEFPISAEDVKAINSVVNLKIPVKQADEIKLQDVERLREETLTEIKSLI